MKTTLRSLIWLIVLFGLLVGINEVPIIAQTANPLGKPVGETTCYVEENGRKRQIPCPVSSSSGSDNSQPTDPRQMALHNAIPRYEALVRSLADNNLLDKQSWLALSHGTEAEFFDAANHLHKILVNRADAHRFAKKQLRDELADLNEIIETYPNRIASFRTDNETMRSERKGLGPALEAAKQQLELTQRATKQLETRSYHYANDAKRDQAAVLKWFAVLLPPGMVKKVSPQPYTSAVDWVPSVPERKRIREAPEPLEIAKLTTLRYCKFCGRLPINPTPLSGTAEDAVAQLEADANVLRTAIGTNSRDLVNQVGRSRLIAAELKQEQEDVIEERETLRHDIKTVGTQLREITTWTLLQARDELQAAQENFLYRAADALIWKRAKSEAVGYVKKQTRRLVAAKSMGVKYRDMTDVEMETFFSAGKRNIFGLAEKTSSSLERFSPVLNRFQTLRTQAQGYVEEAFLVASHGSPREMMEFVGRMDEGMDEACKQLVKANLGALRIPEPWQTIATKYFLKKPE